MEPISRNKPLALDLCSGLGGWTIGLLAAGWRVMGVDIEKWAGYPREAFFQQADVRKLNLKSIDYVITVGCRRPVLATSCERSPAMVINSDSATCASRW